MGKTVIGGRSILTTGICLLFVLILTTEQVRSARGYLDGPFSANGVSPDIIIRR